MKQYKQFISFLIIIFTLSYYACPLDRSPKTIFYICFGAILLISGIKKITPSAYNKTLAITALIFIAYIQLSTLWAADVSSIPNFCYHSKRVVELCALVMLTAFYFDSNYHQVLFKGVVIVAIIHALIIISNHNLIARVTNPIDTGMVYGIAAVIALFFALREKPQKSVFYFLSLTILMVLIFMTKSRGPQLALLISSIPLLIIQKAHIKKFLSYCLLFVFPVTILLYLKANIFGKIFSRGFNLNHRDAIWEEALKNGLDHFWFGIGMSKKIMLKLPSGLEFTHSHNFIIDSFLIGGFIGFSLVLLLFICALYKGFNSRDENYQLWALILLFGGLCLMTNGSIPFTRPRHSWLAFWIPIAMICTCTTNKKHI